MDDERYYCESCGIELTREEYVAGGGYCDFCDAEEFLDE